MIEWIALIILILGVVYLLTFLSFGSHFFINTVFIVVLAILIHRDINKRKMLRYYLFSAIITVIMLIFPYRPFQVIFNLLKKAYLTELTHALLLIFLLAYLFQFIYEKCARYLQKIKKEAKT